MLPKHTMILTTVKFRLLPALLKPLCWIACIADLKIAAGYLDYVGGDPAKSIRANKGTVYSLLAHIYAWKHDYANAHSACQEVINNGGYSLEPMATYTNIWKGQSSPENIFEIAMKYNPNDPDFANEVGSLPGMGRSSI